jgi:hypothetical protein
MGNMMVTVTININLSLSPWSKWAESQSSVAPSSWIEKAVVIAVAVAVLMAMVTAMMAEVSISEAGRAATLVIVDLSWVLACAASGMPAAAGEKIGFPCLGLGARAADDRAAAAAGGRAASTVGGRVSYQRTLVEETVSVAT